VKLWLVESVQVEIDKNWFSEVYVSREQ